MYDLIMVLGGCVIGFCVCKIMENCKKAKFKEKVDFFLFENNISEEDETFKRFKYLLDEILRLS